MSNLAFLVFFVDECVEVSNGSVVCGCWATSKLVWGGMGNVYVGGDGGLNLLGFFCLLVHMFFCFLRSLYVCQP